MTSTKMITKGAERLMVELGYAPLREVSLSNGRRVDLLGLNAQGKLLVVEVKSSLADFRCDTKWHQYLDYCHQFYFAVDADFPRHILKEDTELGRSVGVIVADAYGGDILCPATDRKVNALRAKKLVYKMAHIGAMRLMESGV